jgi:DNA-binding beta-propeller fold protein YncE
LDTICNVSSDGTGFELDNPALTNSTIAYMGNGSFLNYLQLPTTFSNSSSASKSQFAKGPSSMAPGDVYCVKLLAAGYAWLQVTSVSAAGPCFVYRVNTTVPYCGYEQTTADLASSIVLIPTPTATPVGVAVTIAGSVSISGSSPYDVAIFGPTNGAAATMFVPNSTAGTVGVYSLATLTSPSLLNTISSLVTPVGLAVDPNGPYLYVASSGSSVVNQYQIGSFTLNGKVGSGVEVSGVDISTQAVNGALADPRYVSLDSTGNLFITDTGTGNVSDVMEFLSPIPLTATTSVNYWNGSLSSAVTNSIGQVTTAGTTVIVANSVNNRIDIYSASETDGFAGTPLYSINSDNNTGNVVNFNKPQGVAYSPATGLLYISDTGNNRIVEMSISGTFVTSSALGLLSGPTGIKVDNATPPNIYVADTGNSQVVILK